MSDSDIWVLYGMLFIIGIGIMSINSKLGDLLEIFLDLFEGDEDE